MGRLDGKVAIVTGGGGGFGKGIAELFTKEGAKVVIMDMVDEVGQKTASELKCDFVKADVTKRADWEAAVKKADETHGKIDIVINNAGTTYRNKVTQHKHCSEAQMLILQSLPTTLRTMISTRSLPSMLSLSTTQPTLLFHICRRRVTAGPLLQLHRRPVSDHVLD